MKNIIRTLIACLFLPICGNSQSIGIGTTTPDSSAILDLSSSTQGFVMPRMTNAQILNIKKPIDGLMVYCTDDQCNYQYDGSAGKWLKECYNLQQGIWSSEDNSNGPTARFGAASFVLNDIAYVGTGFENGYKNDWYKYHPSEGWSSVDNSNGPTARYEAVSFVINDTAFVGTGTSNSGIKNDWYKFHPSEGWSSVDNSNGPTARYGAVSFVIDNTAYVGTGVGITGRKNDWYKFHPNEGWSSVDNSNGPTARFGAASFVINETAYVGTGNEGYFHNDWYKYHPSVGWSSVDNSSGPTARFGAASFVINDIAYVGTGLGNGYKNDWYKFHPSEGWSSVTDSNSPTEIYSSVSFVIDNEAYVGTGTNESSLDDWYKYGFDPYEPRIKIEDARISNAQINHIYQVDSISLGSNFPSTIKTSNQLGNTGAKDDMMFSTPGGFIFLADDNGNTISGDLEFAVLEKTGTVIDTLFNIRETGEVGVGTAYPTEKLDVEGKIRMREGAKDGYFPVSDAEGVMSWKSPDSLGISPWNFDSSISFDTTHKIGIGIATPAQKLHVNGPLRLGQLAESGYIELMGRKSGAPTIYGKIKLVDSITEEDGTFWDDLLISASGGIFLNMDDNDNGISGPHHFAIFNNKVLKFEVKENGDAHVTGDLVVDGNITELSDVRYKENILPVRNTLEKIIHLNGVTYNWRKSENPDKNFTNRQQLGLIAQEVEAQFPLLVTTDNEGYKSVNYSKLSAVLIEAVKELDAVNNGLKKEIEKLQKENTTFKAKLEDQARKSTACFEEIEKIKERLLMKQNDHK